MKSSAVNLAANFFANGTDNLNKAAVAAGEDFSVFMEKAGKSQDAPAVSATEESAAADGRQDDMVSEETEVVDEVKDETARNVEESTQVQDETEDFQNVEKTENKEFTDFDKASEEETALLMGSFLQEIQNLFMEKFQITEEEFANLMENMNLESVDLLEPSVLTDMVKTLGNIQDSMAFLLDENLYENCKSILNEVAALQENLLENMEITPDDLKQMLMNFDESQQMNPEKLQIQEPVVSLEQQVENLEDTTQIPVVSDVESQTEETEETKVTRDFQTTEETVGTVNEESVAVTKNALNEEHGHADSNEGNGQNNLGFDGFVNQLKEAVNTNIQTQGSQFMAADVDYESIIRQISEQIKIQVTEDMSSMEMYLNPESLGKVEMNLVLKEGLLTARFVVENEQVKEAMESQMMQLQEDLDKQELKVESIEVTVDTHRFEENLMKDQAGNNQPQEQQNNTRRTGLRMTDELMETDYLSEEELTEKIMKEDGTTLNYLA